MSSLLLRSKIWAWRIGHPIRALKAFIHHNDLTQAVRDSATKKRAWEGYGMRLDEFGHTAHIHPREYPSDISDGEFFH